MVLYISLWIYKSITSRSHFPIKRSLALEKEGLPLGVAVSIAWLFHLQQDNSFGIFCYILKNHFFKFQIQFYIFFIFHFKIKSYVFRIQGKVATINLRFLLSPGDARRPLFEKHNIVQMLLLRSLPWGFEMMFAYYGSPGKVALRPLRKRFFSWTWKMGVLLVAWEKKKGGPSNPKDGTYRSVSSIVEEVGVRVSKDEVEKMNNHHLFV